MYCFALPAPPLRRYVSGYWFLQLAPHENRDFEQLIPTDLCADILIRLEGAYERRLVGSGISGDKGVILSHSHVDAQRRGPITLHPQGHLNLIGVRFLAGGLAAVLPVDMSLLSDNIIELDHFFGDWGRALEDQLWAAANRRNQIDTLDAFLLSRLADPPKHQTALAIAELLARRRRVPDVAATLGLSERTVRRWTHDIFGTSPVLLARILRFQKALNHLQAKPLLEWEELVYRGGYYDQAHFIHEFRHFSGKTPEGYRTTLWRKQPDRFLQYTASPPA